MPERGFLVQREARRVTAEIDAKGEAAYASGVLDVERKEMTMKSCSASLLGSTAR